MEKVRQREIKFRAWCEEDEMMFVNIQDGIIFEDGSKYTFADFLKNKGYHLWRIMQWAGITDKNGRDIFEDDIVHCSIEGDNVGNVDTIEFKNGSFWLRYRDRSIPSWTEFGNELEVIGNIWKNPHLLSQGEIKTELI